MKEKVSVIGIGRLGLSFALLLDSKGYDICGCDINKGYIESLKQKTFSSDEPQINELLTDSNIKFTTNLTEAFNHSSNIFIFVQTPSKETGEYDHSYIEQVITELEKDNQTALFKTVIIGCTVMPGYCLSLQKRLSALKISIVYNPSFIAQGSICNNIKNADIVLLGNKMPKAVYDMYVAIMDKKPNFKPMSLTAAEITKISLNCFLTTKISFANRIAEICINSGIENEVLNVLSTIGSDRRIGNEFLRYGYGFSGVCLPRDNRALGVYAGSVGVSPRFQEMVDTANQEHLIYLYDYFVKQNRNKEIPFVFYQLSYKKGVSILTDSQPLQLCLLFLKNGYSVCIIESENVVEQVKPMLTEYSDRVTYVEGKLGYKINLG